MNSLKKVSWTNILAVLIALWLGVMLAGCGSGQSHLDNTIDVQVHSGNWGAKTVRVICEDSYQLGAIRGVVLNATSTKKIRINSCQQIRLRVEALGGDWWESDYIMVEPGVTVSLMIGPTLNLSSYFVRGRP